jgi:hypothetical protein
MAIEKVNEEIDLEIAPDSAQEISTPMMEGDSMMLDDGSAIVNPMLKILLWKVHSMQT